MGQFNLDEMARSIGNAGISYIEDTYGANLADVKEALTLLADFRAGKLMREEDGYKFYYCKSEDSYLLGHRVQNFYYAHWSPQLGFVFDMSRYLPWGETVHDEGSAWKVHTYPSEPIDIGQDEWFRGFLKKIKEAANANP